jgi:lipid II:glycine glycyltransferase (peptidoglycan interpeptide bridge formation enzyme)
MNDSGWEVEVDRAMPAAWAGMLELFSDANLYQTWSYGEVRWGRRNLSHLVLKRGGEVQAMAQLRIVRPTPFNFGMAYLRWGPICELRGQPSDPETAARMARALKGEYTAKRKLYLQILPNAFVGSPRAALFQSAFSGFRLEAATALNTERTFVLDLAPSLAELRKKLDGKWRNMLTQSEKRGLSIIAGNGTAEYHTFRRMYGEMKQRKAFESTVDVDEFASIQEDLPESCRMRILICEEKGVPVAGLVASAMGDSAIYLLGATSDLGLNSKGAYLLQWTLIQWLKENGYRWYDLGGIDPERNRGVYRFKRGLSGADVFQISPLAACDSVLSSAIVRAGLWLRRAVRGCQEALQSVRPLNPEASRT